MRRVLPLLVVIVVVGVAAAAVILWVGRPEVVADSGPPARLPELKWVFKADRPGTATAAALPTPSAIYLAAAHTDNPGGVIYALDPATGQKTWAFDRAGTMLASAAAPAMAGGKLLVGEGLFPGTAGRYSALDLTSGEEAWSQDAGGPVEGGVTGGRDGLYLPAGDGGVVAADGATGAAKWRFSELHVEAPPAAGGGKVFAGGTVKGSKEAGEVVCLDAASGKPVWRTKTAAPAWHVASGGSKVYAGIGTGRPTEANPTGPPAGGLSCFDAATGEHKWTFAAGGGVSGRPFPRGTTVCFGSRDGHLYMVWEGGEERWKVPAGGPVVAGPVAFREGIVAVTVPGRVICVTPDGNPKWDIDLAAAAGGAVAAVGGIRVADDRLYIAAELKPAGGPAVPALICYRIPSSGG